MTLQVEAVGPAHAALLSHLHETAFGSPWRREDLQSLLATPGILALIGIASEAPVAYILCRQAADEAEVISIATHPDHQRQGHAAHLLRVARTQLAGVGAPRLLLEVAADNDAARALYERQGFTPIGRRPGYYKRSEETAVDALLLVFDQGQ
ncbi:GNAT family N-acetyltransferase [Magnetospira sp. QH-2]|uniref:GNAT family N-acetyltransferase n=1 Tax=Magnetospira sp. (strain QH-2) TaxID=1288970 RepID=UPI0003E80EE4|nr:GNAT family N-acetyltransferase [Magnetospira sp. QH-2]CCQ75705.1 GCN5-related N-acetyltransferase [Magnetospira sp. QH-2]